MPVGSNPSIELMTPDEVATMLKISKVGVYRMVEKRHIRFYKVMGSLRFDKEDILAFLQANGVEPIGPIKHGGKTY
jgi:excisionase family DNA binding protein